MTNRDLIRFVKQANDEGASPEDLAAALQSHGQDVGPEDAGGMMDEVANMDPEFLAQLQGEHPQISEEELMELAQAIEEHMANQEMGGEGGMPDMGGMPEGGQEDPMGGMPEMGGGAPGGEAPMGGGGMPPIPQGMPPGGGGGMPQGFDPSKMGSEMDGLEATRTAPYIFGFLKSAIEHDFTVKEAVDFYGQKYAETKELVKEAAAFETKMASVIDKVDDKTAAYLEGVFKSAAAEGLSFDQTVELLKESGQLDAILTQVESNK